MKNLLHRSTPLLLALFCSNALALADTPATGGTPKPLVDTASPNAIKQIKENYGDPVFAIDKGAITVSLPAARANYPGIQIFPPGGAASWDLSSCGHVEATLTNTGSTLLRETMRVDGQFSGAPASDTEIIGFKPGETKVLKVIFGAAWGYKPGAAIDPSKIERVIIFATKSTQDQSFRKLHKATGSEDNYVQADKDGFITSGLLWTPGSAIYYCNGKEILRWENPRVSDEQEYIMYDMVSGGWDNLPLDDAKLPDDFVVDYCRVWQRKDLATPDDGAKPNKGDPSELKN